MEQNQEKFYLVMKKMKKNKKFKVKLIFSDAPDAEERLHRALDILLPEEEIFGYIKSKDKKHGNM